MRKGNLLEGDARLGRVMMRALVTERGIEEERARAGWLEELYRAHAGDAVRLAFLMTGDVALAEDLTQDAFVKVFGRFQDLRNRDAFWWYLRRTIVKIDEQYQA